MAFFAHRIFAAVAAGLMAAPAASAEQVDTGTFDLRVTGLHAGVLGFSGARNEGGYATSARLQSAGIVSLFRELRFDARAEGRIADGRPVPQTYREDVNTGRRESQTVMDYNNGLPSVVSTREREPRSYDLDPATQGGTIDPMTALYELLRAVPREEACNVNLQLYDGRRRTQIVVGPPQAEGDRFTCPGEYRRIAGYSKSDLEERTRYAFELEYGPAQEGLVHVVEVTADSHFGTARLIRR